MNIKVQSVTLILISILILVPSLIRSKGSLKESKRELELNPGELRMSLSRILYFWLLMFHDYFYLCDL